MPKTAEGAANGTRAIALVGPAGAGKTSLAEAMLFASGTFDRQGSTANGSCVGDSSPEARARGGSTELNLMHFDYLGEHFAIIDAPGSVGFAADGASAIAAADMAIVVVDPDPARAALAAPSLRMLDEPAGYAAGSNLWSPASRSNAAWSFSNARTSIWRIRSRLTP